jgi:4-amino-4-deoxy-L-arabinose transferase-like glycosyltransferase
VSGTFCRNGPPDAWHKRFLAPFFLSGLAAVLFVYPLAIPFPLMDPDEGLHASIAQEMVERGNWITPSFLGQPFLDKPIFFFWMQDASLRIFGFNEAAVRLPGLLFGLLGAITTGLLAWRIFGRATGLVAGILYATTILPTALAQAASHDVALIPWINLALLLLLESERGASLPKTCWCVLGAGLFLGLSILTKGLMGVAAVGLAYGCHVLIMGWRGRCRVPLLRRSSAEPALSSNTACEQAVAHKGEKIGVIVVRGIAVLAIAALVAAPWYIAVERQNPGYLQYFLLDRHVRGFATDTQPHSNQPWWYYLPILLGGGLPWIGYLPIVIKGTRKGNDECGMMKDEFQTQTPAVHHSSFIIHHFPSFLWCWLIGWTLLVTLAGSKLATYLWPAFPPLAILAAVAWMRLIEGTLSESARRSFVRTFVWSSWSGPIVLPAVVLALQLVYPVRIGWQAWTAVGVAAALTPLPLLPWRAGRWRMSLAAAATSLAVQFTVVMTFVLPPTAELFTARDLAEHFNRAGQIPPRLLVAEERIGSFVFYLDPILRAELKPGQLDLWCSDNPPKLRSGDVVALPERRLSQASEYVDLGDTPFETVGRYRVYTIAGN